jgi:four helix bundle protein
MGEKVEKVERKEEERGLGSLQVWRRSLTFAVRVCKQVVPLLPAEEKWVLAQQLRRSVQSIPANIAEGHGRYYYQESVRFCYMARGSMHETLSHLTLAHELGYLPQDLYASLIEEINELQRMLNGYIAYLKRSKRGASEAGANVLHDPPGFYLNRRHVRGRLILLAILNA